MNSLLTNSSIVFIVGLSNPSMFSSHYLVSKGVISLDEQVHSSVTIPPLSQILYGQGYRFEAFENRVILSRDYSDSDAKSIDETMESNLPDKLLDSSLALLSDLKDLQLESVGINFRFFTEGANLDMFTHNLPKGAQIGALAFSLDFEPFRTNYTLNVGQRMNPPGDGILTDVNFDGQILNKSNVAVRSEQISELVTKRRQCYENAKEVLGVLGG